MALPTPPPMNQHNKYSSKLALSSSSALSFDSPANLYRTLCLNDG